MNKDLVLMFHEVHDRLWFEKTLLYLGRRYRFIDFDGISSRIKNGSYDYPVIHITFDDGHKSFYEVAFPILCKHNIPATLFVSPLVVADEKNYWFQRVKYFEANSFHRYVCDNVRTAFTGPIRHFSVQSILKSLPVAKIIELVCAYEKLHNIPNQLFLNVSEKELVTIRDSGLIEIGAHTIRHPILSNESNATSQQEIVKSIEDLSAMLSCKIRCFAYPNGLPDLDFCEREMQTLLGIGMDLAFSTEPRGIGNHENPMKIPRIGISKGNPLFIEGKILFAKQWDTFKTLLTKSTESNERRKLNKMMV
ncbi:MAG: polysaccharide deacetylase family protein [Pseudomonadota bacterium]|nr:polysaccharide deacetylase family protein [Pseudomonadota bacterium]